MMPKSGYRFPACAKPFEDKFAWLNASAGEGRSENIMRQQEPKAGCRFEEKASRFSAIRVRAARCDTRKRDDLPRQAEASGVSARPEDIEFAGRSGSALMDGLTAIASRAAAVIRAVKLDAVATRTKADSSPVSEADEAAEAVILDGLARLLPGVPVVSEEAVARGLSPTLGREFILVDPLDGTREFLAGLDEFTVNIALVANGAPIGGVIAAPALDRVWRAVIGRGGERLELTPGAEPAAARAVTPLRPRRASARLVAAVSRSHLDPRTEAFVAALPQVERLTAGSSLKFCRLAEGEADVYPRLAPTREWDVAAGHAILVASGGEMTAPGGGTLTYGSAETFLVPGFLAWADPDAGKRFTAPAL